MLFKPLKSYKVTSKYGVARCYITEKGEKRTDVHTGVDLYSIQSDEVYASAYGKVIFTTENDGTGCKSVVVAYHDQLEHDCTLVVIYSHLDKILVNVGRIVDDRTVLGLQGSTGICTGKHLHVGCYLIPPHIWHRKDGGWYYWDYGTRDLYEIDPNSVFHFYD